MLELSYLYIFLEPKLLGSGNSLISHTLQTRHHTRVWQKDNTLYPTIPWAPITMPERLSHNLSHRFPMSHISYTQYTHHTVDSPNPIPK